MKDVVLYVSLFTLGHSLTLLFGVLGGVSVNAYVIDAIIGLSVVYKGFENINGFERVFKVKPNAKLAVLVFGLFHGLGLATKLQEFMVSENGLVANILSFNAGVRDRSDPGADWGRSAAHRLAYATQLPVAQLRDEHGADGRWLFGWPECSSSGSCCSPEDPVSSAWPTDPRSPPGGRCSSRPVSPC